MAQMQALVMASPLLLPPLLHLLQLVLLPVPIPQHCVEGASMFALSSAPSVAASYSGCSSLLCSANSFETSCFFHGIGGGTKAGCRNQIAMPFFQFTHII